MAVSGWHMIRRVNGAIGSTTIGKQIIASAQTEGQGGAYNGLGATGLPAARLGSAAWTDNTGNLWLFGGN